MRIPISEHYKDQLLSVLTYYMGPDLRGKLMREAPEAYNAYCEASRVTNGPILKVVRTSEGTKIK